MKTESRIQQEIFKWYWNNHCLPHCKPREIIFHVPNENQHKLINIGVLPGVSDLVMTCLGKTFFVEVKDEKGRQQPSQKKFEQHCKDAGYQYILVRSLGEFQKFVHNILPFE